MIGSFRSRRRRLYLMLCETYDEFLTTTTECANKKLLFQTLVLNQLLILSRMRINELRHNFWSPEISFFR